jgi:ferredoxin-NADP reductase
MLSVKAEVVETIGRRGGAKSVRLERTPEMAFRPGQYMLVSVTTGSGETVTKPLSFSSSPGRAGYVEFTKKITGSEYSRALDSLVPGDTVGLKMPYGDLVYEGDPPGIALLAGGIGVTPFKSICSYATEKGLDADIVLIYSSRNEESITFKEDFDRMDRANDRFRVVYTVTGPEAVEKGCTCGRSGVIDARLVSEEIPDHNDRDFFVSGPPSMVKCLSDMLRTRLDMPVDRIRTEKFAGYE